VRDTHGVIPSDYEGTNDKKKRVSGGADLKPGNKTHNNNNNTQFS
jgi:hypothetical protein